LKNTIKETAKDIDLMLTQELRKPLSHPKYD